MLFKKLSGRFGDKFPWMILICVLCVALLYYYAYRFPFTNNAFVVANIRPVAANVEGYITNIYVKNEEYVKKGQPLFTVFKKPYALAYQKSVADVAEAKAQVIALGKQVEKTKNLLQSQQEVYERLALDYTRYQGALHDHAVSEITVKNRLKDKNAAFSKLKSLKNQLELDTQNIIVERMRIQSLEAVMANAKVDLVETTVYAQNNGTVQNMFVALGTPIEIRKPVFSFVDSDNIFIQANFNETDLRNVKTGDKVTIWSRLYTGKKRYHGVVISRNWAVSRQVTDGRSQSQIVTNSENNWFLLPQRLPVQIQITDYDPIHYPLAIGSSAYVYIHAG